MTWQLKYGANRLENGDLHFKVWAPRAETVSVVANDEEYALRNNSEGIFELTLPKAHDIREYYYRINNEQKLYTDPVSRFLPKGVNGPTAVYSPDTFKWTDQHWKGISLKDYILYELHVGTFTPEGTFKAIIKQLPHLKALGITAIELMPVIAFPGTRNWGYDGVSLFAPHHSYGGPDGLKKLINACHQEEIAVVLDVVYNHLGPEKNFLSQFGDYFTDKYKTPWGQAINFDGPYSDCVKEFIINNALYWLTEFHVDALRLDAVHAIFDFSTKHILKELSEHFHAQAAVLNRKAYLIAESDLNDVKIIKERSEGGYALDAQWCDDFHHSLYAYLSKSKKEYFADFGTLKDVKKSLLEGFVYDGKKSQFRKKIFGSSSKSVSGERFIFCIENHDQIGNASLGKRVGYILKEDQYKLATMLLLAAPGVPLLFMGQEWNTETPFLYFTSFEDQQLAKAVREGYQREFNLAHTDTFDPQNEQRFLASKLNWEELSKKKHLDMLDFYQQMIALRKSVPALRNCRKDLTTAECDEEEQWLVVLRKDFSESKVVLALNFSNAIKTISTPLLEGIWKQRISSNGMQLPLESSSIVLPPISAFLYTN